MFSLFSNLPSEIRYQIWRTASCEPRIIELMWDKLGTYTTSPSRVAHFYGRVPPNSSKIPSILHVSQEARMEALSVYQARNFTGDMSPRPKQKFVYYNPYVDVIYFGESTCILTVYKFLNSQYFQKEEITRVAIFCTKEVLGKCDWGHEMSSPFDDVFRITERHTLMNLLHGMDPEEIDYVQVPGCIGLKEVFVVVPTTLTYPRAGLVDESVCFRPAVGDRMTISQERWKRRLERDIERVRTGQGLLGVGRNRWTGNDMPTFKFMSLSRVPEAGKEYDAMNISPGDVKYLSSNNWKFVRDTERQAKCLVKVGQMGFSPQSHIEIGFYGKREGIDNAKRKIEEYVESFQYYPPEPMWD